MKFVYVLTSAKNDTYYEQFFLSVTSLRLFNPDANIMVLIDEKTRENLTGARAGYEKIVSGIVTIKVPGEFSQKEASRWIKTSIHQFIFEDFLFIDCDTIITGELNCDFPIEVKVGAVLDCHIRLADHYIRGNFEGEDEELGFCSAVKTGIRYNGGLIFCRKSSKSFEFFDRWHSLWHKSRSNGSSQDMPALNQANYEFGGIITELGGEWNCQISHNGLPFLFNAKIIHYYATSLISFEPPYSLASNHILLAVKETGVITPEIMNLLENPKTAFSIKSRIIADASALDVLESAFFSKLLWLRRKHIKLFCRLNNLLKHIKLPKPKKHDKNIN